MGRTGAENRSSLRRQNPLSIEGMAAGIALTHPASVMLPAAPALCAGLRGAAVLDTDGVLRSFDAAQARAFLESRPPPILAHAPWSAARLGLERLEAFDVLELFAFVHPATFCVPTPAGLARALGQSAPPDVTHAPQALLDCVETLLGELARTPENRRADLLAIAAVMGLNGRGWKWTPFVFAALGEAYDPHAPVNARAALDVWSALPEWAERAPPPPPGHDPVTGEESRERLRAMLLATHQTPRPAQDEYATRMTAAFAPTHDPSPHVVLAEAGTGIGKTLGYLAPATVWAEKNQGAVWVSTYTRNLQRQIETELRRHYDDPELFDARVAIRKGRENYLCLLNFEETASGAGLARTSTTAVAAGLMARWIGATRAGEFTGADFPAWLTGLLGRAHTVGLSDRRGECIHAACDHYHRCFVERAIRKSRHAAIVVANHALVMTQAALAGPDFALPRRYVFDEGHHVFEAADGIFAVHLSGLETRELRLWLLGPEGGRKGRARGIRKRIEDLAGAHAGAAGALDSILHAARVLPGEGWSRRLQAATPAGSCETFLLHVLEQITSREKTGREGGYSLETPVQPATPALRQSAAALESDLRALHKPMRALCGALQSLLADGIETLSDDSRKRLAGAIQGLEIRAGAVAGWIAALQAVGIGGADTAGTPATAPAAPGVVDWLALTREGGQSLDVGLFRHFVDPTAAFAAAIKPDVQGVAFTSATLRDTGDDADAEGWARARERTGADFLGPCTDAFSIPSPFDYAAQTRVYVVTDIDRDDPGQTAAAFRSLFTASGGGALGLFTAINRLRAVHGRIASDLEARAIPLYAQHVDGMDTGTLVDIFRDDVHACLLGTDALRDGVDVPGHSLRLVVFDRVPWPRPTLLHKARRDAFGGARHDDSLTRLRLKQAFGRLVRRADDRGAFVMLDGRFPSRLCDAFPPGIVLRRLPLRAVCDEIAGFFGNS